MKRIVGIIGDLSGTLLDKYGLSHKNALIKTFNSIGFDLGNSREMLCKGMGKKEHINEIIFMNNLKELNNDRLYELYNIIMNSTIQNYCNIIPNTTESIHKLKNIFISATTNWNSDISSKARLEASKQGLFLDLLISRDNLVNGRPSSDGIKKIMSYFDVRNTRLILKIDDTPLGITEGVNANVWTCGITKFSTLLNVLPNDLVIKPRNIKEVTERLYKEGADYVVSDISEIPKVIESINTRLKY